MFCGGRTKAYALRGPPAPPRDAPLEVQKAATLRDRRSIGDPGLEPATARPPLGEMGCRSVDGTHVYWVACLPVRLSWSQFARQLFRERLFGIPGPSESSSFGRDCGYLSA